MDDPFANDPSPVPQAEDALGETFIVGGPDPLFVPAIEPLTDPADPDIPIIDDPDAVPPVTWVDPATRTDPGTPDIVVIGGPGLVPPVTWNDNAAPAAPADPNTTVIDAPDLVPPVTWTDHPATTAGPASPNIAIIGGPGVPLSPSTDPLVVFETLVNLENREAVETWAQVLGPETPVPTNADGSSKSAAEIYMELMTRVDDPNVQTELWQRIVEIQQGISTRLESS